MVSNIGITLSAQSRTELGSRVKKIRKEGLIPAVVYGQKTKNFALSLDSKEFKKIFKEAGENSLINLKISDQKKDLPVLIHAVQKNPLNEEVIHVDFYRPNLEQAVKAFIPLKIIGESLAVKNLGGTLVKKVSEIEVKALPMHLPSEIIVDISSLKNLGNEIFVKELSLPEEVEVLKGPDEVVVFVAAPSRVEEELEKPIEEKIEEVEGVVKPGEGEEAEKEEEKEGKKEKMSTEEKN